jgi:hypothetical protein
MKIKLTKEEIEIIKQMCDLTLKAGGLNNLQSVVKILSKLQEKPQDKK